MTILAVDPGYAACGWAIIDNGTVRAAGTIRTKARWHLVSRLIYITSELLMVAEQYDATHLVIEDFVDQGSERKQYSHRDKAPKVIGAIVQAFGQHKTVTRLDLVKPSVLGDWADIIEAWKNEIAVHPGDVVIFGQSEHARDACAHGLNVYHEERRMVMSHG